MEEQSKKLEALFDRIIADDTLVKEFLLRETMDDMYKFCLSLEGDITKDEFDEFVAKMIEYSGKISDVKDDDLDQISGGGKAADVLATIKDAGDSALTWAKEHKKTDVDSRLVLAGVVSEILFRGKLPDS